MSNIVPISHYRRFRHVRFPTPIDIINKYAYDYNIIQNKIQNEINNSRTKKKD